MRAPRKSLFLPAALLCSLFLGACTGSPGEDQLVYLFIDLTEIEENGNDYNYLEDSIGPLMRLLGHGSGDKESRAGASVHILPIYDFPLNRPVTVRLERGSRNQNPLDRRDAVKKFEAELRSGIEAVVETNLKQRPPAERYRQSHIFGPLCEGLREIQRQGSELDQRRVIVFSDMLENSPVANFYRQPDRDSLTEDLNAHCTLPDLSGICMNIVFQPVKEKSVLILEAKSFWISFLESRGLPTTAPSCFSYESYL